MKVPSQQGQVAIFAVLVFNVFFVFFAMVINVGLLVHHKINLQNSVDLAAYYASMKQAESMNAIAHVNYQIRQSWKLLTYRYRAIGMAGNSKANLPLYCSKDYTPQGQPGQCVVQPLAPGFDPNSIATPGCATSFCGSYQSFKDLGNTESYCNMNCTTPDQVPLPVVTSALSAAGTPGALTPAVITSLISYQQTQIDNILIRCQKAARNNFYLLGSFIYGYKKDIRNRRDIIEALARDLSESSPFDMDGQSIRNGALESFKRNLTQPNLEDFNQNPNFELVNGLAQGGCQGGQWLEPIYVRPAFRYLDAECNAVGIIPKFYLYSNNFPPESNAPNITLNRAPDLLQIFEAIQTLQYEPDDYTNQEQTKWASMVGYEKNPWCMNYVKVTASVTPKIPFSPLGKVTLRAEALAKPFGGQIGPWYKKTWPSGNNSSGGSLLPSEKVDPNLTIRGDVNAIGTMTSITNDFQSNPSDPNKIKLMETLFPNHSRYVGDPTGVIAYSTLESWLDGIYNVAQRPVASSRFSINDWIHTFADIEQTGDILSWDKTNNAPAPARKLELQAILPDQFDLSYYQIEANFHDNYLLRLRKNQRVLAATSLGTSPTVKIRGDLGYRADADGLKRFNIADQFKTVGTDPIMKTKQTTNELNYRVFGLGYTMKYQKESDLNHLLTRWTPELPGKYSFKADQFAKCLQPIPPAGTGVDPIQAATPGNCIHGGRNGYSVKLIHPKFLTGRHENLGGPGLSGNIKNPPP